MMGGDIPHDDNDPAAYRQAADRVTADSDRDVWVVESNPGSGWRVAAVLTSYEDAEAYIEDAREFSENCPENAPERHARNTIRFRHGGRKSPNRLYETWPPENEDD